jgi:hypothetical protein
MCPNEVTSKFVSATISRGVTKHPPDDSYGDGEAWVPVQASRARSPHASQFPSHLQRHSKDIVGLTRAGGGLSAESEASDATRLKSKRRGGDALESTVPAKRPRTCGHVEENMPAPTGLRVDAPCQDMRASSSSLSKWQSPRTSPLGPRTSTYCRHPMPPSRGFDTPNWFRRCVVRNLYSEYVSHSSGRLWY